MYVQKLTKITLFTHTIHTNLDANKQEISLLQFKLSAGQWHLQQKTLVGALPELKYR